MINIYPKRKKSVIKNCKKFLNLTENHEVTYSDINEFKKIIKKYLYTDMLSPKQIALKHGLVTDQFHVFISKSLGIKLRNNKDATNNFLIQNNKKRTNEKENYWHECKFKFSPYTEKNILGYELLNIGVFEKPQNKNDNTIYLHRDHMLSISYGWEHNIDPKIISHPANCRIMKEIDNIKKGNKCSISYDDLLDRIKNWNSGILKSLDIGIISEKIKDAHIENIRKAALERKWFNDGIFNYLVKPDNKKSNWILGKNDKLPYCRKNDKYSLEYINEKRKLLNLPIIPEIYKDSILSSKFIMEKLNWNLLNANFLSDYKKLKWENMKLKDIMECSNISYYNNKNRKLFSNFMEIQKMGCSH